jgi:hypothetical protein
MMDLHAGHLFLRFAGSQYVNQPSDACVIPPAEFSSEKLTNRFSGRRLDGKEGQGALDDRRY